MIVGLTGYICAGKDVAANHLAQVHGFKSLSFGDAVRAEAARLGLGSDRPTLQRLGYDMSSANGNDYWAIKLKEQMTRGSNYVVNGFRQPEQIKVFRSQPDFTLLGICALEEIRRMRYASRERPGDIDFDTDDKKDRGLIEGGQQTDICFTLADAYIPNNRRPSDFRAILDFFHEWLIHRV
ncbi:MAG: AAA family ATPase [Candidatus Pacearchaeota archaeon]